jgi:hypothetical protein
LGSHGQPWEVVAKHGPQARVCPVHRAMPREHYCCGPAQLAHARAHARSLRGIQALEVELLERFSAHESIARFCGAFKREEDALWSVSQELWIGLELCTYGSAGRCGESLVLPSLSLLTLHTATTCCMQLATMEHLSRLAVGSCYNCCAVQSYSGHERIKCVSTRVQPHADIHSIPHPNTSHVGHVTSPENCRGGSDLLRVFAFPRE